MSGTVSKIKYAMSLRTPQEEITPEILRKLVEGLR